MLHDNCKETESLKKDLPFLHLCNNDPNTT